MSQCEFISSQASHFSSKFHLDDHYGSGGGGGYLQGGSPFSASGSPSGGRVSRAQRWHCAIVLMNIQRTEISQSLRPLTVKQLNKASQAHVDAEWRVDDVEIGQVRPAHSFLYVCCP
jgi:replication factor A2